MLSTIIFGAYKTGNSQTDDYVNELISKSRWTRRNF